MHTSEVLAHLAEQPGERLSLRDILANLGDRSFALLIVILGLPNCIPMPPPIPTLSGLLLIVVAVQIGMGLKTPWLPGFLARRSVAQKDVRRASEKALPVLVRLERFSRPRLQFAAAAPTALPFALLLGVLALGVLTAAPFIGQIPWGLAICLAGLGLVERDGVLIIACVAAALVGASLSAGFIYAIIVAIRNLF